MHKLNFLYNNGLWCFFWGCIYLSIDLFNSLLLFGNLIIWSFFGANTIKFHISGCFFNERLNSIILKGFKYLIWRQIFNIKTFTSSSSWSLTYPIFFFFFNLFHILKVFNFLPFKFLFSIFKSFLASIKFSFV